MDLNPETINPWDPVISLTATVRAALTTGNAIMLSAMTTIIGFSVLTWTFLVPIQPMRTVGITLFNRYFCHIFTFDANGSSISRAT